MGETAVDRWKRTRWRLYAPIYDLVVKPFDPGRQRAIELLDLSPGDRVLILGSGTGLDLPYLPEGVSITAVDLSPTMVQRTRARGENLGRDVDAQVGDASELPFEDDSFDAILAHLVLTVVPDPGAVLAEAKRVLDSGGVISVYDKFVPDEDEPSLLRRALDPVARLLFSSVTRQLGPMLDGTDLAIERREWRVGGLYAVALIRPRREAYRSTAGG